MDKENLELHGGNIYKVFREKNIKEILDYSSNINPFGIPESLKTSIIENMNIIERYPDPEYLELREKIAKNNNVKLENIIVGNGATEIIFLFMKILAPKKVLIVSPTFAEYERGIRSTNNSFINENIKKLEIDYFQLLEEEDFKLNIEKLITKLETNYDLLVICNPNNPTGKYLKLEEMEKILKKCNETNTKFFVDEAFYEFVENGFEESIIKTKENKENLFIIRAFTKFFAIPGLRLGYGICFNNDLLIKMNEKKEPWSVNNFAELAGIIVLDDIEYINKTNNWIKEEKEYMFNKLNKIDGIIPYKTEVNFILVKICDTLIHKELNVKTIRKKMLENGILIRDASNFKYLDDRFFRLAIKDRENNNKVIECLKKITSI